MAEKINIEKIGCRQFDIKELVSAMMKNQKVWSWGANNFQNYLHKVLKFKVQGCHHKGHVYIVLASNDTFDVYLTSIQGTIKKKYDNIYIDQLIDVLDKDIEYIKEYADR